MHHYAPRRIMRVITRRATMLAGDRSIEILYIEGTSGPWPWPSSRQREKMSRTDPLCPIAHAACPARQRRMVQFIGSLTLEPAGYHGRAHLQRRRLYLVPSMYSISMDPSRGEISPASILSESRNYPNCVHWRIYYFMWLRRIYKFFCVHSNPI